MAGYIKIKSLKFQCLQLAGMFADITFESNEHIKSVISVLEDFCSPCPQFMENISLEFFCGIHLNFVYYMACVDRGM